MPLDRDRIRERVRYVREQLAILQPLAADADLRARRMSDPLSYAGMVRCLQTSVEAMIHVAFHLCAKRYAKEPQSAADAFEILAQRGDLPQAFLPRVRNMVRFRNLVVHGSLHAKSEMVDRIISEDLQDFIVWEGIVSEIAHRDHPSAEQMQQRPTTEE